MRNENPFLAIASTSETLPVCGWVCFLGDTSALDKETNQRRKRQQMRNVCRLSLRRIIGICQPSRANLAALSVQIGPDTPQPESFITEISSVSGAECIK